VKEGDLFLFSEKLPSGKAMEGLLGDRARGESVRTLEVMVEGAVDVIALDVRLFDVWDVEVVLFPAW